jgi:hypothetical protein
VAEKETEGSPAKARTARSDSCTFARNFRSSSKRGRQFSDKYLVVFERHEATLLNLFQGIAKKIEEAVAKNLFKSSTGSAMTVSKRNAA